MARLILLLACAAAGFAASSASSAAQICYGVTGQGVSPASDSTTDTYVADVDACRQLCDDECACVSFAYRATDKKCRTSTKMYTEGTLANKLMPPKAFVTFQKKETCDCEHTLSAAPSLGFPTVAPGQKGKYWQRKKYSPIADSIINFGALKAVYPWADDEVALTELACGLMCQADDDCKSYAASTKDLSGSPGTGVACFKYQHSGYKTDSNTVAVLDADGDFAHYSRNMTSCPKKVDFALSTLQADNTELCRPCPLGEDKDCCFSDAIVGFIKAVNDDTDANQQSGLGDATKTAAESAGTISACAAVCMGDDGCESFSFNEKFTAVDKRCKLRSVAALTGGTVSAVVDEDASAFVTYHKSPAGDACATSCNGGLDDTNFMAAVANYPSEDDADCSIGQWDLTLVTSLNKFSESLADNSTFNADITSWNVGNVESMAYTFADCASFNQDINTWQTSAVKDMKFMFTAAATFSKNLGKWKTDAVTSMWGMFLKAGRFNGAIAPWQTSAVTDMGQMFARTRLFNKDISSFDTSNVDSMNSMFYLSPKFNQNVNAWNVANVVDFTRTFRGAEKFNSPLNDWDLASATTTEEMFHEAVVFNNDIDTWQPQGVTSFGSMFHSAEAFAQDLNSWQTSAVTDMHAMFLFAEQFNSNLGWDTCKVKDTAHMFRGATAFNGDVSGFCMDNVTTTEAMFTKASAFTGTGIDAWDFGKCRDMSWMFDGAAKLNVDLGSWETRRVTNMYNMFRNAAEFSSSLTAWNVDKVANSDFFSEGSGLAANQLPSFAGAGQRK